MHYIVIRIDYCCEHLLIILFGCGWLSIHTHHNTSSRHLAAIMLSTSRTAERLGIFIPEYSPVVI